MRIGLLGTFDVENFGDLLFPLIANWRAKRENHEIVSISPTNKVLHFSDAVASRSMDELFSGELGEFDRLVLGGGNIVHSGASIAYDDGFDGAFRAYPSLWLASAIWAAEQKCEYVWNAPGVPNPFQDLAKKYLDLVLKYSAYVSVRDLTSVQNLGALPAQDVQCVPDSAIEISRIFPKKHLDPFFEEFNLKPGRYIVFHVKDKFLNHDFKAIVALINNIVSELQMNVALLPLGQVHGDLGLSEQISKEVNSERVTVVNPNSLQGILSVLAHSACYVGSSLHGMVTTLSYGGKGVIIGEKQHKFEGFLKHFDLEKNVATRWSEVDLALVKSLMDAQSSISQQNLEEAWAKLDTHWAHIFNAKSAPGIRGEFLDSIKNILPERPYDHHLRSVGYGAANDLLRRASVLTVQKKDADITLRQLRAKVSTLESRIMTLEAELDKFISPHRLKKFLLKKMMFP